MSLLTKISNGLRHFFHVVSNVRPSIWISLYIVFVPVFALIYWAIPDSQFRVPDGASTGFGGWLYYSIVTISTLGFGDYTPSGPAAQCVTAVEVMCGLVTIGFFLNAVGSMKSEIDVESELEKQRRVHNQSQLEKLQKNIPVFIHKLNLFLSYCYAVTTPKAKRAKSLTFNENFTEEDLADMHLPAGIPGSSAGNSAVDGLLKCSASTCLYIDALQTRVDFELWPDLLEDSFAFVANYQLLPETAPDDTPHSDLSHYIRTNAALARKMEAILTDIASKKSMED